MTKEFVIELFHEPEEKRYFEDDIFIPAVSSPTISAQPVPISTVHVQADPSPLEDRLMDYYTVKLEAIAGQYQDGCQEWLMQAKPDLYQSLCLADNRVNEVWKSALAGGASVTDFEAAVTAWYDLQLEGIRLYRDTLPKPEDKPVEAKQTIPACYCCHSRQWWVSFDGRKICGVCHPPAKDKIVKEWIRQEGASC